MSIWPSASMAFCLLLLAAGLMASHLRTWRRVQEREIAPDERDYARRQYRRRMQTSAMLGLLGVAVFAGGLVASRVESKLFVLGYWGAVVLVVLWVGLLAVVDMVATKHHFNRMRDDCLVEQAKLQAELRRLQAGRGNGEAGHGAGRRETAE